MAQPSPKEARDIFATRVALESYVIAEVLEAEGVDWERLEHNTQQERQAHQLHDRSSAIRLSGEFHLLLATMTGNQVLADILHELIARTSLIIAMYGGTRSTTLLCSCDEHEDILENLKQQQLNKATKLMRQHLKRIEDQLVLEIKPSETCDLWHILTP
ncbi:MAG: GntR family transcriptional regulator [Deinococcales bacterium]